MGDSQKVPAFKKLRSNEAETTHYSLLNEGVPDEFRTYAETELKETPENVVKGMRKLKQFLETKKGKNLDEIDDITLRTVLRCCKYDTKKSVEKLNKFLETQRTNFEKIAQMDMKIVEAIIKDQCVGFLPYRDKHGRAILFSQPSCNLELYSLDDCCVLFSALAIYTLRFPMTSLFGIVYLGECKCPSVSLLYKILKNFNSLIQFYFSLPFRTRKIHILNENAIVNWFLRIIRPVLPSKINQRISFHGSDLKSLQKYYHPDILPDEFGGSMGPIDTKFYRKELLDFIKEIRSEYGRKNMSLN